MPTKVKTPYQNQVLNLIMHFAVNFFVYVIQLTTENIYSHTTLIYGLFKSLPKLLFNFSSILLLKTFLPKIFHKNHSPDRKPNTKGAVTYKEGSMMARTLLGGKREINYLECSSLTMEGVNAVFARAAESVLFSHKKRARRKCSIL